VIQITIDPVLAYIGPFWIKWYGLTMVAGVLVAIAIVERRASRAGVASDTILWLALCGLVPGVVAGRGLVVASHWDFYSNSLRSILTFEISPISFSFPAALLGGSLATGLAIWMTKAPVTRLIVALAPALLLGEAMGLVGAIAGGDGAGTATSLPWSVVYQHPAANLPSHLLGAAVHPVSAYQIIANLAMVYAWWSYARSWSPTQQLAVFLAYFGLSHLLFLFLRPLAATNEGIASAGCLLAMPIFAGIIILLPNARRRLLLKGVQG
jgi:phosphatidylglycerol---prolipoprotein diacylglyceryl transferase